MNIVKAYAEGRVSLNDAISYLTLALRDGEITHDQHDQLKQELKQVRSDLRQQWLRMTHPNPWLNRPEPS
jgi:predicted RNA-binding protein associated with RNAse of E/G family